MARVFGAITSRHGRRMCLRARRFSNAEVFIYGNHAVFGVEGNRRIVERSQTCSGLCVVAAAAHRHHDIFGRSGLKRPSAGSDRRLPTLATGLIAKRDALIDMAAG